MKLLPSFLLAIAALAAPAVLGAASFEGQVRMKISDARGRSHEMEQRIKGDRVRTEMNTRKGETMAVIMDLPKREMIMLMPEQHMYMVHALPDPMAAAGADDADFSFEKTGETEKILGYTCTKYLAKSKDATTDVWVTEELGRFAGFGNGPGPMGMGRRAAAPRAAWEKALAGKDFFPLRVVSHDAKGKENFRLEALSVDKSPQPDSLFVPPADFRKFDMGGMMQGLGLPRKH